jgi:hypothetical protein
MALARLTCAGWVEGRMYMFVCIWVDMYGRMDDVVWVSDARSGRRSWVGGSFEFEELIGRLIRGGC